MSRSLSDILIFAAGVDRELLADCPTYERLKYTAMGFAVVLTALFATISGTYSFYSVVAAPAPAVLVGALWGTFILNLDRLLLTTLHKGKSWRQGWGHAVIRLLLAIVIGISIAHPLTLRLFQEEINQHLEEARLKRQASIQEQFEQRSREAVASSERAIQAGLKYQEFRSLETRLGKLNDELRSCEVRREDARKRAVCECAGTCGTGEKGEGPECRRNQKQYDALTNECSATAEAQRAEKEYVTRQLGLVTLQLSSSSQGLEARRDHRLGDLQRDLEKQEKATDRTFSRAFLSRSIALADLTQQHPAARTIVRMVMLLFVLIEIAPIAAKLIARHDALDALVEELHTQYVGPLARKSADEYIRRRASARATGDEARQTAADERSAPAAPAERTSDPARPQAGPARRVLEVLGYRRFVIVIVPGIVMMAALYITGDARVAVGAASLFISMTVAYWTQTQQRGGTA